MSEYLIKESTLSGIADAIRAKTGYEGAITAADMADKIEGITTTNCDALIERNLTEIISNVETVGDYAFYEYDNLASIRLPYAKHIGNNAFNNCTNLLSANIPLVTSTGTAAYSYCKSLKVINGESLESVGVNSFGYCTSLVMAYLPYAKEILAVGFQHCTGLDYLDLPNVTSLKMQAFYYCSSLVTLILRANSVVELENSTVFNKTPIADGIGYIYVPKALIDSYKSAANWSTYANQFRALEDYTDDGTTSGELDASKI